jgi:hypothetical protein
MEKKPRDHARQLLEKRAGKPMLTADYSRGVPQMTEQVGQHTGLRGGVSVGQFCMERDTSSTSAAIVVRCNTACDTLMSVLVNVHSNICVESSSN